MNFMKTPIILAVCSTFALGACTDPAVLGNNPDDPNRKTKQGAFNRCREWRVAWRVG